jgi:hypothetical protein
MPLAVRILRKAMAYEASAALTYTACGEKTADEDPEDATRW